MKEWKRIYESRRSSTALEQQLREANSKQQEHEIPSRNQRRIRNRTRNKSKDLSSKLVVEKANESVNSSMEVSDSASPGLSLHAKMLEDALKSAKKETPRKQNSKRKNHKKTPTRRKQALIKLPSSPKVKKLEKLRKQSKILVENKTDGDKPMLEKLSDEQNQHEGNNTNQNNTVYYDRSTAVHSVDLEVAENLLQLQKGDQRQIIINQVSVETEQKIMTKSNEKADTQVDIPPCSTSESNTISTIIDANVNKIVTTITHHAHHSLSSLLETPLKLDDSSAIPNTPGNHLPSQLTTPLLKYSNLDPMNLSLMKHHEFPTPEFPITPGCIFTPFKDINSPRSDQEMGFSSSNRPTDYSSGSSYYKPDESDGVDKQLRSLMKAGQRSRSHSQQSCDEVDNVMNPYNLARTSETQTTDYQATVTITTTRPTTTTAPITAPITATTTLIKEGGADTEVSGKCCDDDSKLDSSSSSSSSSTSSDSSVSSEASVVPGTIQTEHTDALTESVNPSQCTLPLQTQANDIESTIKDHLHSAPTGKSTLMLEKEIIDKQAELAEKQAKLEEKRLRVKNSLRETEMRKVDKPLKGRNMSRRARIAAEARIEPLRGPPIIHSPSKRKHNQQRKIPTTKRNIQPSSSGRPIIVTEAKPLNKFSNKKRNIETEKLIRESTSDNATGDTFHSTTGTLQSKGPPNLATVEESVEVIQTHLNKSKISPVVTPLKSKQLENSPTKEKLNLIEILEDSDNDNKKKDEEPNLVSTTKSNDDLNPPTKKTKQKSIKKISENNSSKSKIVTTETSSKEKETKKKDDKAVSKTNAPKHPSAPGSPTSSTVDDFTHTPYKHNQSDYMRDLFGNISDNFETPIKSPTAKSLPESSTPIDLNTADVMKPADNSTPKVKTIAECVKAALDDADTSSDDDDDDDESEMELVICTEDESNKNLFQNVVSTTTAAVKQLERKPYLKPHTIILDNRKIVLSISEQMELYSMEPLYSQRTQKLVLERQTKLKIVKSEPESNVSTTSFNKTTKTDTKAAICQPNQLSTASKSSCHKLHPKINIKHKDPIVLVTAPNATHT